MDRYGLKGVVSHEIGTLPSKTIFYATDNIYIYTYIYIYIYINKYGSTS